ncbi:MAG: hypothetical protein SPJ27_10055 [Candidatus Onthovivens sp.]|nr:hypothetical protein [Candidatus Onthovivens sp.]
MNKTLGIGSTTTLNLTKEELINLINKNYPDDAITKHEDICNVMTVENYAGEIN